MFELGTIITTDGGDSIVRIEGIDLRQMNITEIPNFRVLGLSGLAALRPESRDAELRHDAPGTGVS